MTERIDDGHPTTVAFSAGSSGITFLMYEKGVTPPGVSAGGENDTTTMRNDTWRTKAPKSLKSLMPSSFTGAYDPEVLEEVNEMVGVNQEIVITFPDSSTWTFWGWMDEFIPNEIVEGEQPTANVTIIPSNQDASGDEIAPEYSD